MITDIEVAIEKANQQPHTFTGLRGQTLCTLKIADLYAIVKRMAEYKLPHDDPDAVAQNFCCDIEKRMGIYPNVPSLSQEE